MSTISPLHYPCHTERKNRVFRPKNKQRHSAEAECRLFCCPILLGRCQFCSFLKLLSYQHTPEGPFFLRIGSCRERHRRTRRGSRIVIPRSEATWESRSTRPHRGKAIGENATAFPRFPRRFAPRNDKSDSFAPPNYCCKTCDCLWRSVTALQGGNTCGTNL